MALPICAKMEEEISSTYSKEKVRWERHQTIIEQVKITVPARTIKSLTFNKVSLEMYLKSGALYSGNSEIKLLLLFNLLIFCVIKLKNMIIMKAQK